MDMSPQIKNNTLYKKINREIYNKKIKDKPSWGAQWNKSSMEYLRSRGDEKCLDNYFAKYFKGICLIVGVGNGYQIQRIARNSQNITSIIGIDISARELKIARQDIANKYKEISNYILCDAENFPMKKGSCDSILCKSVLHHLNTFHSIIQIKYVQKNTDSIVCLAEPGKLNFIAYLGRKFFPTNIHTPHETPFIFSQLRQSLFKLGLMEIEGSYFYLLTPIIPILLKYIKIPPKWVQSFCNKMLRLEESICKSPLKNLAWSYISIWK